jgi:hypothetical protein
LQGPSIPVYSTIEKAPRVATVGKLSECLFQSRDSYGQILDNTDDIYEMSFTPVNDPLDIFYVTSVYKAKGLY